jgi:hypothetical protein
MAPPDSGFTGFGKRPGSWVNPRKASFGGFYETAGIVKVFAFVFAFVFSLLAFLFLLLLLLLLSFLVSRIHLGLLYALDGSRSGLGA